MIENFKFTIAIPAYKASFLGECIESILAQTISDFELIIVNDASPENIDGVLSSHNSEKIRYFINSKNFGAIDVVDNWNKCLEYARGDYFILMGDDDKMLSNYLNEFSNLIEKFPKCDVFHCRTLIVNQNGLPVKLTEPRPEFETVYDTVLQRMKGFRHFFISDYVFRTETLRKNGGFFKLPLAWGSDDISCFVAAKNGIAHTNNPVFIYRENTQTISSTGNVYSKMEAILGYESWLKMFVKQTPSNAIDALIHNEINKSIKLFIQKTKIRTIYSSKYQNVISLFFKWYRDRQKYNLSTTELIYASLMAIKEKQKQNY